MLDKSVGGAKKSKAKSIVARNDEIAHYELGYLLSPLVASDKLAETIESELKHWLAAAQAEISGELPAKLMPLAYPIKKVVEHKGSTFREAYFGAIYFSCRPELLENLETSLSKSSLLIRSLVIKLSPAAYTWLTHAPRPVPALPESAINPELLNQDEPAPVTPVAPMSTAAIDQEIDQLLV